MNNCALNLQNFDISIFKKGLLTYLYVYNTNYSCFLKTKNSVRIKNKKIIEMYNYTPSKITSINTFMKQFALCESSKIKFTGKGYKIKKHSKESLMLLFNRSHITTIWWKNIFVKKLKKYKIYIRYNTVNKNIISTILNVRPINIFTKKGLRSARQILFKKKGKK